MSWRRYLPSSLRDMIEVDASELKRLLAEAAAEVPRNSLVLDAGAGEGQYRDLFSHTRYIGVDLAVGDAAWNYSGLSALNTLERLSFPDGVFDVVVCTQVLEHVAEPEHVLCELQRVLRRIGSCSPRRSAGTSTRRRMTFPLHLIRAGASARQGRPGRRADDAPRRLLLVLGFRCGSLPIGPLAATHGADGWGRWRCRSRR